MQSLLCPMCRRILPGFTHTQWYSTVTLGNEEIPVITFPAGRQKAFVRRQKQTKNKGKVIIVPRPGKLFILTDERRLNLYTNEFPSKFEPPSLASQTWTSQKSPGRFFTIHPTRENPSIIQEENNKFEDLKLSQRILDAVKQLDVEAPTNIQAKAIPEIINGENIMLSAETGSGKTLAYLLPIMHRLLKLQEDGKLEKNSLSALILTPSKELCHQVLNMANSLNLPFKIGNLDDVWLKKSKKVASTMDVLISTPILMLSALRRRMTSFDHLQFIVVDECDTLLDQSFSKFVCNVLGRINVCKGISKPLSKDIRTQLILCSATFPAYAAEALKDVISFSDISAISTGYMHRVSAHTTQKFLRLRPSEKFPTVVNLLQETSANDPSIVFCNKKETVHWLTKELRTIGLNAEKNHSGLNYMERVDSVEKIQSGESNILIATDLSSRGLDTQRIRHVINYDFPNQASDYIHRSGRVGRVGQVGEGRVTNFICRRWEIPLVMKIEEAARRRERIEGVDADIKSIHAKRWEKLLSSNELD